MRVTSLYLKKWLQSEFKRLGIDIPVLECYKTRFRSQDYECGAASYIYRIGEERCSGIMYIFSPKGEIEHYLNNDGELHIILKDYRFLDGAQVSVRKKK